MKRVYVYLLLVLFPICFSSCDRKLDSYPPHLYSYYLSFVDKSGNDLLKDIVFEKNDEGDTVLLRGTYFLEFIKTTEDIYSEPNSLILRKVDGYQSLYVNIGMSDWYQHKKPEVITHKLSCQSIFGNKDEHILISYWKFDSDYTEAELIRFTVDGKEGRISGGLGKFFPLVTATLDK